MFYNTNEIIFDDGIHWDKTAIIGSGTLLLNTTLWLYYDEAWYAGDKTKFHSTNDWYNEKINIDKLEHIHGAITLQRLSYHLLRWSNFPDNDAKWISSAVEHLMKATLSSLRNHLYDVHKNLFQKTRKDDN